MAIEVNIYKAESISLVNKVGASGSKWIELAVRESNGAVHEFNIFAADMDKSIAMFLGCREDDA